jgi:hypothetical protein
METAGASARGSDALGGGGLAREERAPCGRGAIGRFLWLRIA